MTNGKRRYILPIIICLLIAVPVAVLADTTLVRNRGYNHGDTPGSWAYGDSDHVGSDGVNVVHFLSTIDESVIHYLADMTFINANVVPVNDSKLKVSADDTTAAYLADKLTGGDGLTATEINPGGNEDLDLDVNVKAGVLEIDGDDVDIADDGVGDDHHDWGLGANQVASDDLPNDTTNFNGNLSGSDTDVLAALETLDELPTGGGTANFYLETTASDIGGYKLMADTYANDAERNSAVAIIADATPVEEWATIVGKPGQTVLATGVYQMHFHAEQNAGTKNSTLYFEIYKRTEPGGVETLLGTSEETGNLGVKASYTIHTALTEQVIDSTDRLVVKVLGNESGAGTDPQVTVYYQGTNISRLEYPSPSIGSLDLNAAYINGEIISIDGDGPVEIIYLVASGTPRTYEGIDVANQLEINDDAAGGGTNAINLWHFDDDSSADNDYFFYGMSGETTPGLIAYLNASGLYYGEALAIQSGGIINEDGDDVDTRIEGDTDANLLFVDAGEDRIGIGDGTPDWKLDVAGNIGADDSLYILEQAAADADVAGYGQPWVKTATPNELWFTDDAGTDFEISTLRYFSDFGFTRDGVLTVDGNPYSFIIEASTELWGVSYTGIVTIATVRIPTWIQNGGLDTLVITVYYGAIGAEANFTFTPTATGVTNSAAQTGAVTGGAHHIFATYTVTAVDAADIISDLTLRVGQKHNGV